jgi:3',5'-cyclic AMP phosphodiesterase CpdA
LNTSKLFTVALGTAFHLAWADLPAFAQQNTPIAFLSDIHLQDVYADLNSAGFNGVVNPKNGKLATIRTMGSQLNSTRLFNENYFALLQALEDLAQKKIKLVVLPGDFTDDGQPMNVLALKRILQEYAKLHGMRFFITTGNHDPVSPFGSTEGKSDFLGKNGEDQPVAGSKEVFPNLNAAISDQINAWGYYEICGELAEFGFSPSRQDLFWTHPFEDFDYEGYSWEKAHFGSAISKRTFTLNGTTLQVPDASYLVEPVKGIWLLAIDGNVYSPGENTTTPDKDDWSGSSVGFNLASKVKAHQLEWIKVIAQEAKKRNKTLISFSHYPLVDFHNGASEAMKQLFGKEKFQLSRVPDQAVSEQYLKAGIRLHVAGHMHQNNTGIYEDSMGNKLINIQVPSLAAFPPAYKILEQKSPGQLHFQTEQLEEVARMDEFFDLYRMEYSWLSANAPTRLWNEKILSSEDYLEYNQTHLRELIRRRFIRSDWPANLGTMVNGITLEEVQTWSELSEKTGLEYLNSILSRIASEPGSSLKPGTLMEDFYLIKNGGDLGKSLIPGSKMMIYQELLAKKRTTDPSEKSLQNQFIQFLDIFSRLLNGEPSDDFVIDLDEMEIKKVGF